MRGEVAALVLVEGQVEGADRTDAGLLQGLGQASPRHAEDVGVAEIGVGNDGARTNGGNHGEILAALLHSVLRGLDEEALGGAHAFRAGAAQAPAPRAATIKLLREEQHVIASVAPKRLDQQRALVRRGAGCLRGATFLALLPGRRPVAIEAAPEVSAEDNVNVGVALRAGRLRSRTMAWRGRRARLLMVVEY